MIGARQSNGHMTVGGHPANPDVWSQGWWIGQ